MSCFRVSQGVDPATQPERAWRSALIATALVTSVALVAIGWCAHAQLLSHLPALNLQLATYSAMCGGGILLTVALANLVFLRNIPRASIQARSDGASADDTGSLEDATGGATGALVEHHDLSGHGSGGFADESVGGFGGEGPASFHAPPTPRHPFTMRRGGSLAFRGGRGGRPPLRHVATHGGGLADGDGSGAASPGSSFGGTPPAAVSHTAWASPREGAGPNVSGGSEQSSIPFECDDDDGSGSYSDSFTDDSFSETE